jgi:hypothetical protein
MMTRHPVYRALHVPKTVWHIDMTLFMYSGAMGLLVMNVGQSTFSGIGATAICYGCIRALTAREPRMIAILWSQRPAWLGGTAGEDRYDAARWVVHEDQH